MGHYQFICVIMSNVGQALLKSIKLPVEWEAYDCTRSIKLPGKPLMRIRNRRKKTRSEKDDFVDTGRIKPNRRKQEEWVQQLGNASCGICIYKNSIVPVSA